MGIGPAPSQRGKERTAHDFTLPPLLGAEVLRPHAGLGRARGLPGVQSGLPVGRGGPRSLWRGHQGAWDPGGTPVPSETRQTMTCKEVSAMKLLRLLLVAMLGVVLLPPRATAAQAQAPTPLVITAHNVTAATAPARENGAVARPGDVIRYALVFTNVTAGPVKNIQFVDPIPKGMIYVPGSAAADHPARIEYSIDGGKSYSAQPTIQVVEEGRKVEKPAPRQLYTHVRWTVLGSLATQARVMAEFRTQVSEAPGDAK